MALFVGLYYSVFRDFRVDFNQVINLGKISQDCTERDLRETFSAYGELSRCTLKRGFAFVTFENQENADKALDALNGTELFGRSVIIEPAKERNTGSYFHLKVSKIQMHIVWNDRNSIWSLL